jgi:predicted dehydrogenase
MKVLIVGLGSIGRRHVAALHAMDKSCTIVALRSQAAADHLDGVINAYSWDALENISFDFAIVSNPTSEHKATIATLMNLGCPLFIEKPLHASLDLDELLAEIAAKGLLTYVACNLRFLDCLQYLKQQGPQLAQKRLQEVNIYCGSYLPEWRKGQDFRKSYSANAEMGGGVHIDLIHELDYAYWLWGMPERVSAVFRNRSALQISAFDYANYILEYPEFAASVVLNYYRRDAKRTLELVFEDETWLVDLRANRIDCNGRAVFASAQTVADTYLLQMQYFVSLVKKPQPSFNTVQDAYNVLKICLGS